MVQGDHTEGVESENLPRGLEGCGCTGEVMGKAARQTNIGFGTEKWADSVPNTKKVQKQFWNGVMGRG